ncbi:MAG: hypothetical protein IJU42_02490 [Erysipelotrichaceae bacterium]|nr:hypothetical protein [Erysipelotrichaceae bacterium]
MKIYRCRKDLRVRYFLFGLLMLGCVAYLIIRKRFYYSKLIYNIAFLTSGTLLGVFYCLRGFLLRLQFKDNEIFFWDGLVDVRHIRYDDILKIEYNPVIRIRFYMRDDRKTEFSIPNVFTPEDTKEILDTVKKKRKRIEIDFIGREKAIDTSRRIERSRPIRKKEEKK